MNNCVGSSGITVKYQSGSPACRGLRISCCSRPRTLTKIRPFGGKTPGSGADSSTP